MSLKLNLESIQTKAKERTVKTQSIEYDLETLVKKVQKGIIKLDPDYQRRHRWTSSTSSKLIESLILNIPIPTVYLSYDIDVDANEEGARYSVIDGQQRLTAIVRYFENKFPLEGLEILKDLDGCSYKDLPPFLLRRLEERTIKCLRIDSTVDPQVKYDIFERLNSGSVELGSQELRNAVHRGPFNDLCKELAKDLNFRTLLHLSEKDPDDSSKVKKMEDVELVLRFFSLIGGKYTIYKKGPKYNQFKDFLSENLNELNRSTTIEIDSSRHFFLDIMAYIRQVFGDIAFAKYKFENGNFEKQSNFNAAVYDALSIAIATEVNISKPDVPDDIAIKFKNLFKDPNFHDSVSGSILDSNKILTRINLAREIFRK